MPRLNGKFVSKAVFEAAMEDNQEEANTMSEYTDATEAAVDNADVEAPAKDRRSGPRPGTALKHARLAVVKAQSKLDDAQRKLNAFDHGRDELQAAVDAAAAVVADAEALVESEAAAL